MTTMTTVFLKMIILDGKREYVSWNVLVLDTFRTVNHRSCRRFWLKMCYVSRRQRDLSRLLLRISKDATSVFYLTEKRKNVSAKKTYDSLWICISWYRFIHFNAEKLNSIENQMFKLNFSLNPVNIQLLPNILKNIWLFVVARHLLTCNVIKFIVFKKLY